MKKWIFLIILSSILLILSSLGLFIAIRANKPIAVIKDDEAIYASYELVPPTEGTPEDYNAKDNVAYALYKIKQMPSFKIITTGKSKALGLTQNVSNTRTVIGNEAIVTTITSGYIKNATERYFKGNNQSVLYRSTKNVEGLNATFPNKEPKCVSKEQYLYDYGWYPYQLTGYIICDETYLKDPTIINNNDGTYTLSLDLDPDGNKAPYYYKHEILINSSSTMIPKFSKIHLDITIDNEWKTLMVDYEESYSGINYYVMFYINDCRYYISYNNEAFLMFNRSYILSDSFVSLIDSFCIEEQ